jgi:hypothetical protein
MLIEIVGVVVEDRKGLLKSLAESVSWDGPFDFVAQVEAKYTNLSTPLVTEARYQLKG